MSIPAGKHQSHNPQDNEYFKLNASHPDLVFGKTQYPAAHTVVSPEQWDYHGSVTLSLPFTVKASAAPGAKTINVSMDYGLCFDTGQCEPPELAEGSVSLQQIPINRLAISPRNLLHRRRLQPLRLLRIVPLSRKMLQPSRQRIRSPRYSGICFWLS
jgi:hypothetical protein